MNKISERILNLMKDFGFTEYRLTQKADITAGTLNRTLKAGNAWKQAEQLYKISKVFDVSLEYLITGNKTIHDENQRVIKLQQANLKLTTDCDKLKERNKSLQKAVIAFANNKEVAVRQLSSKTVKQSNETPSLPRRGQGEVDKIKNQKS